jgi:hypothetical protein
MNGFFFRPSNVVYNFSILKRPLRFFNIFNAASVTGLLSLKMKSLKVNLGSEKVPGGRDLLY